MGASKTNTVVRLHQTCEKLQCFPAELWITDRHNSFGPKSSAKVCEDEKKMNILVRVHHSFGKQLQAKPIQKIKFRFSCCYVTSHPLNPAGLNSCCHPRIDAQIRFGVTETNAQRKCLESRFAETSLKGFDNFLLCVSRPALTTCTV